MCKLPLDKGCMSGEAQEGGRGYARNLHAGSLRPMVDSWDLIYQMSESRGREARGEVNSHKFRHTFSHN